MIEDPSEGYYANYFAIREHKKGIPYLASLPRPDGQNHGFRNPEDLTGPEAEWSKADLAINEVALRIGVALGPIAPLFYKRNWVPIRPSRHLICGIVNGLGEADRRTIAAKPAITPENVQSGKQLGWGDYWDCSPCGSSVPMIPELTSHDHVPHVRAVGDFSGPRDFEKMESGMKRGR